MFTLKCCGRAWNWCLAVSKLGWYLAHVPSLIQQEIHHILINMSKALFFSSLYLSFPVSPLIHYGNPPITKKKKEVGRRQLCSAAFIRKFYQSSSSLLFTLSPSSLEMDLCPVCHKGSVIVCPAAQYYADNPSDL